MINWVIKQHVDQHLVIQILPSLQAAWKKKIYKKQSLSNTVLHCVKLSVSASKNFYLFIAGLYGFRIKMFNGQLTLSPYPSRPGGPTGPGRPTAPEGWKCHESCGHNRNQIRNAFMELCGRGVPFGPSSPGGPGGPWMPGGPTGPGKPLSPLLQRKVWKYWYDDNYHLVLGFDLQMFNKSWFIFWTLPFCPVRPSNPTKEERGK